MSVTNLKTVHFITYVLKISDKKMYFRKATQLNSRVSVSFAADEELTPTKDNITARSLQYVRRCTVRCTNFVTKYMYRRDPYCYMDPVCSKIQYRQGPPLLCISSIFFRQRAESILKLVLAQGND